MSHSAINTMYTWVDPTFLTSYLTALILNNNFHLKHPEKIDHVTVVMSDRLKSLACVLTNRR